MKQELQQKLFKNYPELFIQKDESIKTSCMGWGICCGDGWFELINLLCSRIQNRIENFNGNIDYKLLHTPPSILPDTPGYLTCEVAQVKEKFGGLRFYVDCDDDYIRGMISLAEGMSYKLCSKCGEKSSNQVKRGWVYTLCSTCRDEKTNEEERLGKINNL